MSKPITFLFPSPNVSGVAPSQTLAPVSVGANPIILTNRTSSRLQLTPAGQSTQISFSSTGDNSATKINISGIDSQGNAINELINAGPNNNTVTSVKSYQAILSIDNNAVVGGSSNIITVNLGNNAFPAYQFVGYARNLVFTTSSTTGNVTIIGINHNGKLIMEVIAGTTGSITTNLFTSVLMATTVVSGSSTVSIGESSTPPSSGQPFGIINPVTIDIQRVVAQFSVQGTITGTLTYQLYYTLDPLQYIVGGQGYIVNPNITWLTWGSAISTNTITTSSTIVTAVRCGIMSGTGSLKLTLLQQGQ